jgi:hypothetical protein
VLKEAPKLRIAYCMVRGGEKMVESELTLSIFLIYKRTSNSCDVRRLQLSRTDGGTKEKVIACGHCKMCICLK